jgi:alkanesulfonate monooxygenase SsuD/methylene tetrahydromethanopterin reductase-like flavin-dependent oxidoreductase (luciferase family)
MAEHSTADMKIGLHLTPFYSPADRPAWQIIDELVPLARTADRLGFGWISAPHHWASHPTVWPQPFQVLARLAPETSSLRLMTLVLLLPLLNALDVAEQVATLDQISHGRFTLGAAIGYRDAELQAVGLTRKDRVPKLEESLQLLKRLWSGETVTFDGRYCRLQGLRMGFTPMQVPHPPIIMGAQSEGAARRAGRLADGVFFGPQVAWADLGRLADVYRAARQEAGRSDPGILGASRSLILGVDKADAIQRARAYLERTFTTYRTWEMQERTMVPLQLSFEQSLEDWTIHGSPRDCVETILRVREKIGLTHIGFTIYSLPRELPARLDTLQLIAEEILKPVGAA